MSKNWQKFVKMRVILPKSVKNHHFFEINIMLSRAVWVSCRLSEDIIGRCGGWDGSDIDSDIDEE